MQSSRLCYSFDTREVGSLWRSGDGGHSKTAPMMIYGAEVPDMLRAAVRVLKPSELLRIMADCHAELEARTTYPFLAQERPHDD